MCCWQPFDPTWATHLLCELLLLLTRVSHLASAFVRGWRCFGWVHDPDGVMVCSRPQEIRALGYANIVGALFNCYTTTGSFSRSAVNNSCGAQSRAHQISGDI